MFADFIDALLGAVLSMSGLDIVKMMGDVGHWRRADLSGGEKGYGAKPASALWALAPFW